MLSLLLVPRLLTIFRLSRPKRFLAGTRLLCVDLLAGVPLWHWTEHFAASPASAALSCVPRMHTAYRNVFLDPTRTYPVNVHLWACTSSPCVPRSVYQIAGHNFLFSSNMLFRLTLSNVDYYYWNSLNCLHLNSWFRSKGKSQTTAKDESKSLSDAQSVLFFLGRTIFIGFWIQFFWRTLASCRSCSLRVDTDVCANVSWFEFETNVINSISIGQRLYAIYCIN